MRAIVDLTSLESDMRIDRIFLLTATLLLVAAPARAATDAVFAPDGCEFSVEIDGHAPPETAEWGGRLTFSTAAESGRYAIRAACTTGYPDGALPALGKPARVAFVSGLAQRMQLAGATVDAAADGAWIDIDGALPPPDAAHLRARFVYGASSRLMVEVLSSDETTATEAFNSVIATIKHR